MGQQPNDPHAKVYDDQATGTTKASGPTVASRDRATTSGTTTKSNNTTMIIGIAVAVLVVLLLIWLFAS